MGWEASGSTLAAWLITAITAASSTIPIVRPRIQAISAQIARGDLLSRKYGPSPSPPTEDGKQQKQPLADEKRHTHFRKECELIMGRNG